MAFRCGASTRVVKIDTGSLVFTHPGEDYETAVKLSRDAEALALESSDAIVIVELASKAQRSGQS